MTSAILANGNTMHKAILLLSLIPFNIADAQSPGGASSNLRVWYKANANAYSNTAATTACANNATVAQWNDQTANTLHLTQATSGQRPTWLDGSASAYFNYNPSIKFTDHYLQRAAPGILVNGTAYDKINLYAVYYDYDAANFDWLLFTNGANGFTRVSLSMNFAGGANMDCDVPSTFNRVSVNTATNLPVDRTNIIAVKADKTGIYGGGETNKVQAFTNGTAGSFTTTHTSITEGNFPTEVGDNELVLTDATNSPFTGELGELFLYTGSITQALHQRIESYLALKYSAKLNSHDYFSSAGTTVYINSGSCINGVIGIGRDDNSGWMQKQSRQPDDSTRAYISTLATTNAGNAGTFSSDGQFVVIGHNGGQLRSNASTAAEKPAGLGIFSRLNREWKVTNTAFGGTFGMSFKLNTSPILASDLRLLVDDDGNFTNASLNGAAAGLSFTYAGGVVTVTGISTALIPTNGTRYITIASVSNVTPLPVELTYFDAQPAGFDAIDLHWITATEHDNDHFDVQRGADGAAFEKIGEVSGHGNSLQAISYAFLDRQALPGANYYRLSQVDHDGIAHLSPVVFVKLDPASGVIVVAPNPAQDEVLIGSADPEVANSAMELLDAFGNRVMVLAAHAGGGRYNIAFLPAGTYIVRSGSHVARLIKR